MGAQVRAVMQKKLCRPVPLETIGTLTVATLRELAAEAGSKGGRSAPKAAAADDSAAADEGSAPAEEAPAPQAQAAAPEAEAASKKVQAPSAVAVLQKAEAASAGNVVAQEAVAGDKKVPRLFFPGAQMRLVRMLAVVSTCRQDCSMDAIWGSVCNVCLLRQAIVM